MAADEERWGVPDDLSEIDGGSAAEGVDPGAGGRSGATGADEAGVSTGGSQDRAATPGSGLGTPDIGQAAAGPGGGSGTPGALTANDDLVGGDPEQRAAQGRRELPQPTARGGERDAD